MNKVFLGTLAAMLLMWTVAQMTIENKGKDKVEKIVWQTDANPARKRQTALFEKLNPGLQVIVDPSSPEKLIVQCATGTGPDIIDHIYMNNMGAYVDTGILMDLTGKGVPPELTYPALRPGLCVGSKQYRFPCNVTANCMIYNKGIFDELKLPYPKKGWTYNDLIALAAKINQKPAKDGGKFVPVGNRDSYMYVTDLMAGYGGRIFSADGLHSALDSTEAVAAMRMYHDLIFKYKAIPSASEAASLSSQGGWGMGGINWFSSGRAAMMPIGRWFLVLAPSYPALKGKLGVVQLPRVGDRPSSSFIDARCSGINFSTKHPEAALKFLQFLAGDPYNKLIIEDGDSLPPNFQMAKTGKDLVNAVEPDAAFHQAFIDAARDAKVMDLSPFMDLNLVARWLIEVIQKVEADENAPVDGMMKSLADEINAAIRLNLERNDYMQRKFKQVTGRDYSPEWWKQAK